MANKAKDKQSKDADRLRLTKKVQDKNFAGINLKTGEMGLRELSEKFRGDKYGTPLSEGAISAGVKKIQDAPFFERFGSRGQRSELDRKAAQAAREAADEERREARGMKKGGSVKSSASKRADGIAKKGKTKGRVV
jgi:hypothetical protein